MTTTPQSRKKGARRRMKQMQGLLRLSRLDESVRRQSGKAKPLRVTVALQPQLLEIAYSALADQDMQHPLGRVDLRDAKLEQVPDGFIIHEACTGLRKKVKLQDKDKATTDAWFFAVYTAITEYERLQISASEDVGHKFSAVLTSSLRDEHTETVEFELSCQLSLPTRPIDEPSIKWKVWKTFAELQAFDDELRVSFGAHMTQIAFPRDRKRDSIFGGMRKRSLQDLKEQQLALYVEQVFQMPEISTDPVLVGKVKKFLGFDSFFEITPPSSSEDDATDNEVSNLPMSAEPIPTPYESQFVLADEASNVSEPPLTEQDVVQPATEQLSYETQAPPSQYSSTDSTLPALLRRQSSTTLEDEGEEFVEVIPETDSKAAKKLHKKIIRTVRELVSYDEERVQDFQDQTRDFGREKTSAMEYCAFLLGAVGAQECCKLIPEMARLLPDEVKRDELIQARAAIWRRTHRRHRRRSKQFSESVVMQTQKEEQQQMENAHNRMRPKSDSLSVLNWGSERGQPLQIPGRNSMIERPMPVIHIDSHIETEKSTTPVPAHRAGVADPRRHLNRRASFNTMFGETLQTDPIKEENPAENDSDGDSDSDDSLLDIPRESIKASSSIDRKSLVDGNARSRPSSRGRQNSSFMDGDDDDESTEDDEEIHHSGRSRHSRHRHQSGSGSGSLEKRAVKERPLSRVGLTRTRSRQSSSFIESDEERSGDEGEDSHTRFRRSQRRASRKFDEETKSGPAPEEEENPVLARLKKQGAVNFMMQLR